MAKKAKYSAAFMKVFGDSLKATEGLTAQQFEDRRYREGKTARKHGK